MKKLLIVLLFLIIILPAAFSQDRLMSAGFGLEWNMNSHHNFAGGAVASFDYALLPYLALGLSVTGSSNFNGTSVLEPTVHGRFYVFENCWGHKFFAQYDLGAFLLMENQSTRPLLDFGFRGGMRAPLGTTFYLEPFGRWGYPFAFSLGLMAGNRF
ncbi:MAG: hypothetical protein FWH12_07535 [Treponema sp.]|nr:hypothetical protein [Treponema sp.]